MSDLTFFEPIRGFEDYQVSEDGQIYSTKRNIAMKQLLRPDGYMEISLRDGLKTAFLVHRIVAEAYIPNPNKLPEVNHKDKNRTNNHVTNLEWVTKSENIKHSKMDGSGITQKGVTLLDSLTMEMIRNYASLKEASEDMKISYHKLSRICRGVQKNDGEYFWKYTHEKRVVTEDVSKWKKMKKYPNYKISEAGQIYSIKRKIIMSTYMKAEYLTIKLFDKDSKPHIERINRLVAENYVQNNKKKPYVNHKDGVKINNDIQNLEWVSPSENTSHAVRTGLIPKPKGKAVIQYDEDGNEIARYDSFREASRATGANENTIPLCCRGKRQTSGGFRWAFQTEQ